MSSIGSDSDAEEAIWKQYQADEKREKKITTAKKQLADANKGGVKGLENVIRGPDITEVRPAREEGERKRQKTMKK